MGPVNKILGVIIVLIFILGFLIWVGATLFAFMSSVGLGVAALIPGLIIFGFWGLVAYRLIICPEPGTWAALPPPVQSSQQ